ncbi:hypothetical protein G9A89_000517 [Geosiphon pyriformis]|nr:hypothetical protein G9A89_000517 [Geosiphon pyriformis]
MKVQYIGKLTELKFQQFSDQITSIILDHYFNITDSAWTLTELSLEDITESRMIKLHNTLNFVIFKNLQKFAEIMNSSLKLINSLAK